MNTNPMLSEPPQRGGFSMNNSPPVRLPLIMAAMLVAGARADDYSFSGNSSSDSPYELPALPPGTSTVFVSDNYYASGDSNWPWMDDFDFSLNSEATLTIAVNSNPPAVNEVSLYFGGGWTNGGENQPPVITATLTAGSYQFEIGAVSSPPFSSFDGDQIYSITMVVSPPPVNPPVITGFAVTNGQASFTVASTAGFTNIVQGSTDLSNWVSISTNIVPANNSFAFADTRTNLSAVQFYRILQP